MSNHGDTLYSILADDALTVSSRLDFTPLQRKSVLITGASGLIGLNLIISLVAISKEVSGVKIIAVIRSKTSSVLSELEKTSAITVLRGDLTDTEFLASLPPADVIIHAAGSGIPAEFLAKPIPSLKINTLTTFHLLEKLAPRGRFLFISSSDIYNGFDKSVYDEEDIGFTNTNHPRACYIEGKRTGEAICHIYHQQQVNAYAIRLSLTYGPGVSYSDNRVLPSFIRKALDGKITMLDSGEGSRTFCYISDAIEMIWFILLYGRKPLYNVGGDQTTTIKDLATLIAKSVNVPLIVPEQNSSVLGAPQHVKLNIGRILRESGKSKFIDLEEGLKKTIKWLKELKRIENETELKNKCS